MRTALTGQLLELVRSPALLAPSPAARYAQAGLALVLLAGDVAAQVTDEIPVTPLPGWMRYGIAGLFAFALGAGGLAIGAGIRNKVVYSLSRGIVGTALGVGFLSLFAPTWLAVMAPAFVGLVVLGVRRDVLLFNDRTDEGSGWQWGKPSPLTPWRRFDIRRGVWVYGHGGVSRYG